MSVAMAAAAAALLLLLLLKICLPWTYCCWQLHLPNHLLPNIIPQKYTKSLILLLLLLLALLLLLLPLLLLLVTG